jgi:cyclophilin family peptidyl-prolyl cis-trans isomerase
MKTYLKSVYMSYKNHLLRNWRSLATWPAICLLVWAAGACQAATLQDSPASPPADSPPADSPSSVSPPDSGTSQDDASQDDASQDNSAQAIPSQTNPSDADTSSLNPAAVDPPPTQAPDSSQVPAGLAETPVNPNAVQAFSKLVEQIARNENEINKLYSSMPLGFPALQGKFMSKIAELKKQNIKLKSQMNAAALESFRAAPQQDVTATQLVFRSVKEKIDGSAAKALFDPQGALEVAQLMMNNGLDAPQIAYLAFRACYAIHDFEQADSLLSRIEETGFKLSPAIRQELEATRDKWEREQSFRRLEETADDLPRVLFETSEGNIVVELFENHAPKTVGNFVSLVEKRFYDDLTFHLVKPGQLSQAGCPVGDGSGDAGYKIPDETDAPEIRHHFAGTISMANTGKDTAGSQFFISHQPNANLDGNFTVFGVVTEGLDTVYRLQKVDKTSFSTPGDVPSKIIRATVLQKRDHEYSPTRIEKQPDFSLDN